MKKMFFSAMAAMALFACTPQHDTPTVTGCMDPTAVNFNSAANSSCSSCCTYQGGVLFYLTNPAVLPSCGLVTVTLNNGQTTTIGGTYPGIPASCVNLVGGYLLVNTGTYSYTITSPACPLATGSVTVVAGCNKIPI
jgi:hypothetical protein